MPDDAPGAPRGTRAPGRGRPPGVRSLADAQRAIQSSQLAHQVNVIAHDPDVVAYATEVRSGQRRAVPATGISGVDVMGDLLNQTVTPFVTAPPDDTLGTINQYVGGALQLLTLPFDLIDNGLAILTAPVASMFESPAAVLYMPHLGTPHAHTPPVPPVPMPSIGTIIGAGALNVMIGGIPAARAGDVGIAATCLGPTPPFMIITGSSNVFFGGSRAARMLDMTIHCNPIIPPGLSILSLGIGLTAGALGTAAEASAGNAMSAAMQAAQAVADAAAEVLAAMVGKIPGIPPTTIGAILLGVPTVMIGGVPMPPSDMLGDIGRALGILKAEAPEVDAPNRRHQDGETDPDNPHPHRRGYCEC